MSGCKLHRSLLVLVSNYVAGGFLGPCRSFSRRRRTYIRVPQTDLGYLDFLLSAQTQILGFLENFEFLLAGKEWLFIDSDAPIGPVVAPWIV